MKFDARLKIFYQWNNNGNFPKDFPEAEFYSPYFIGETMLDARDEKCSHISSPCSILFLDFVLKTNSLKEQC